MTRDDTNAVIAVQVANLDQKLDAIHTSLKEDVREVKDGLREVETQTRATNGRVTDQERVIATFRGALWVLTASTPFLLFVIQELAL